ncbi:MAG: sulfatase-like hydrolase/transferase [Myxococcota bacterium]|nr:sulfatase-like hydrolase/transferase [Myxococcota bacterium]
MSALGMRLGLLGGLLLSGLETLLRYLPAHAGTDLSAGALLPVAAGIVAALPAGLLGLLHPAAAAAAVVAIGAGGGGLAGGGLGLLAAGLGWLLARDWRWSGLAVGGALLGAVSLRTPDAPQCTAPVVVLAVLDTVGASATSLYGAPLPTTPTLEALAQRGAVFSEAISPAPWTLPAHAALLTGQHARIVGGHHEHLALSADATTLAERLSQAGWRTGAFIANPWISRQTGMTRGFQHQEHHSEVSGAGARFSALSLLPVRRNKGGRALVKRALSWVGRCKGAPSFVLLNLLEAHSPLHQVADPGRFGVMDPARISARMATVQLRGPAGVPGFPEDGELEAARRLYAAGVAEGDALIGALVAALPDAAMVVTADHGEAFGEHDVFGHMIGIHAEVLAVPLVVVGPGVAAERITAPVSTVRVHDTVLQLAGLPGPDSLLSGDHTAPVFSEQLRPVLKLDDLGGQAADWMDSRQARVQVGDAVLVRRELAAGPIRWWRYDRSRDPGELQSTWSPGAAPALVEALHDHLAQPLSEGEGAALDDSLRARLHALGYVEP